MKQFLIIACLSLLLSQNSFSQENSLTKSNLGIKLMPLSMFDRSPRYRVGLEYISDKKLGYTLDVGYGNYILN